MDLPLTGLMNRQTFYHNVYEKKIKSNIKKAVLASGGKLHRRAED